MAIEELRSKPKIYEIAGLEFELRKMKTSDLIDFVAEQKEISKLPDNEKDTRAFGIMKGIVFKSIPRVRVKINNEWKQLDNEDVENMEQNIFDELVKKIMEVNGMKSGDEDPK